MPKVITISSKRISCILLGIISFLLIADLLIIYLRFVKGFEHLRGFIHGFYFDTEANFPSLYSAAAIFFSAGLLWLISSLKKEKTEKRSVYWKVLSIVFVFLAIDEFGSLHEYLIQPVREIMDRSSFDSGYLYFAWFIPYTILLLILGMVLLRFLYKLPSPTRWLFIISGAVFLSGAVGMEMVGGKYWAEQGWSIDGKDEVDIRYALMVTLEELLEMLGVVVFIYALTSYYLKDRNTQSFTFVVTDEGE